MKECLKIRQVARPRQSPSEQKHNAMKRKVKLSNDPTFVFNLFVFKQPFFLIDSRRAFNHMTLVLFLLASFLFIHHWYAIVALFHTVMDARLARIFCNATRAIQNETSPFSNICYLQYLSFLFADKKVA